MTAVLGEKIIPRFGDTDDGVDTLQLPVPSCGLSVRRIKSAGLRIVTEGEALSPKLLAVSTMPWLAICGGCLVVIPACESSRETACEATNAVSLGRTRVLNGTQSKSNYCHSFWNPLTSTIPQGLHEHHPRTRTTAGISGLCVVRVLPSLLSFFSPSSAAPQTQVIHLDDRTQRWTMPIPVHAIARGLHGAHVPAQLLLGDFLATHKLSQR